MRVPAPGEQQQGWEDKVELLFNGQAPAMNERFEACKMVEIARLLQEHEIGGEQCRSRQTLPETAEILGQEQKPGDQGAGGQDRKKRRQDPSSPALVEARYREIAQIDLAGDDAGDEIAADHEEDIDPGKSARQSGDASVAEHYRDDRYRAQTFDLGTVAYVTPPTTRSC